MRGPALGAAVIVALLPSLAAAQSAAVRAERANTNQARLTDPSLVSPIATDRTSFTVSIADDKKTATAKTGVELPHGLTLELGFTGVFDKSKDRSNIGNIGEMFPGSKGWVGVGFQHFNLRVTTDQLAQQEHICHEAALAANQTFGQFDCTDEKLPRVSLSDALGDARARALPDLCRQFAWTMGDGLTASKDHPAIAACLRESSPVWDDPGLSGFGDAYLKTYVARFNDPAVTPVAQLAICNEFRRSNGDLPLTKCADKFAELVKDVRSWRDRFADAASGVSTAVIAICNQYRIAKSQPPSETVCAPSTNDPVFTLTFYDRYRATYSWGPTLVANVRADASRQTYEYRDASLEEHKPTETHVSHTITASGGVITSNDVLFAVNFTFGTVYKAGDAFDLCQPVGATGSLKCESDVVLSGPTTKTPKQLEFQIKGYASKKVGLEFVYAYDYSLQTWGFELPVYFMTDKDGGLSGGLTLQYRHKDDSFAVVMFVGSRFKLFN